SVCARGRPQRLQRMRGAKIVQPRRGLTYDERDHLVIRTRVNADRAALRGIHARIFNELREDLRQSPRVAADKAMLNVKVHRHAMTALRECVAGKRVCALDDAAGTEGSDFELDGAVQDSCGVDEAIDRLKRCGE